MGGYEAVPASYPPKVICRLILTARNGSLPEGAVTALAWDAP